MKNPANPNIQAMKPYCPPLAGRHSYDGILLDFNERTIPPSKKVTTALKNFLDDNQLQIYPEYNGLRKQLAKYAGVKTGQVMITNGSDQGIDLIFRTFTKKGDKVVIPSPSFAMFCQCAKIMENKLIMPSYKADLSYPINEVLKAISEGVKLVIICNPNNPTGTLVPLSDIKRMAAQALKKETLVYVDEAYFEFTGVSAVSLIAKYPNIIVTRTFSKAFGLSSLRIGYTIAQPMLINEMIKVQGPYDVNVPACVAANSALADTICMQKYVDEVMNKAKPMVEAFLEKNKITYSSSQANFMLIKPDNSKKYFDQLKRQGILTRPRQGQNIEGTIRVSIGTVKQMKQFIKTFKKLFLNS